MGSSWLLCKLPNFLSVDSEIFEKDGFKNLKMNIKVLINW